MIEDLKADSAKWDAERRAHSRTSGAQNYRYSETHSARQQQGPSADAPQYPDASGFAREYDQPRYPGTGTGGYTGASNAYGQPTAAPYGSQAGGYPQAYGGVTPQYAAQQDPRYANPAAMMQGGYGQPEAIYASGANRPISATDPRYGGADPYGNAAVSGRDRIPTTMGGQSSMYATAPAQQQAYPATTQASAQAYYPQAPASSTAYAPVQPSDPFYGRASPAGAAANQGFASPQGQQQYETAPSDPRASVPSSRAQVASSGTSSSRRAERDSDRHADRHGSDRRHQRSHRS
jgi:hypothetical protein